MTVYVSQGVREVARAVLKSARVTITREGYSDATTTTWAFIVRTRRQAHDVQQLLWRSGLGWVMVDTDNRKELR